MTARIRVTTETQAPEATKPILSELKRAVGMVPNIYATIGHSPGALASVLGWNDALTRGPISKRELEQINLHVSELNGCGYCVSAHGALAARLGLSVEDIARARVGLGANEREDALLAFARRVVRTGGARAGSELSRLREANVSDAEIIDLLAVVALASFRNAVSIVADVEVDFPKAPRMPAA